MWKFWRTEEPIYWLVFYYDIFTLKSEACDKSILKSFYNNDPLCGEPWFLRLRTRDKNFVYSHDSTYLLDDLIMNEKFADACLTIKYKRDKKTKEFYVANYDPLYPFPLNFSHIGNFIFISVTWVRLKLSREVVNTIYLFK